MKTGMAIVLVFAAAAGLGAYCIVRALNAQGEPDKPEVNPAGSPTTVQACPAHGDSAIDASGMCTKCEAGLGKMMQLMMNAAIPKQSAAAAAPVAAMSPQHQLAAQQAGILQQAGIDPQMITTAYTLSNAPWYMDGPGVLLARSGELGLTAQQSSALSKILADARSQAGEILTDAQRELLGDVPDQPITMAQMQEQVYGKIMMSMQRQMLQQFQALPQGEPAKPPDDNAR